MRKRLGIVGMLLLLGFSTMHTSCVRNGCPAEIQYKKKKQKKKLTKSSKTNLWPKNMRKKTRDPKF